ncbi:MAG: DUF87 domain-containing protein [Candidatus Bathyarchaeota archaeon]
MKLLGEFSTTLGFYKEHPTWSVPINAKFIPYHIGIFAVTGGGKSFLARCEVIPLVIKAGYDVIIFDWAGSDYVPHFDTLITFSDISLDDDVVMSYLTLKMDYFGYLGDYKYRNNIRDAMEDVIYEEKWRKVEADQLKGFIESNVVDVLVSENRDRGGNVSSVGERYIRKFKK